MKTNPPVFRFTPWLVLGVLLLPAWTQADPLTNAMNAVTVRVLCINPNGDGGTGSDFTVANGSHVVTDWHVVACTQEGGKVGVLLNANTQVPIVAEIRGRSKTLPAPAFRLSRQVFSAFGITL